ELDARPPRHERRDRVLREQVRRHRLHPRARRRDGEPHRRDLPRPRRHADRVLRPPRGALPAAARRTHEPPRGRRRRGALRAPAAAGMRGPRAPRLPVDGVVVAVKPTLLVLRALGLGDLLTAVPALCALADAFPAHRRVLAAPRALAPLALATGT